ncbi:MAG: hypothetical protein JWM93_3167 [Frankiales bacterium]|nr:hypothetical protein [Frankiales bacterium]
MSVGTEGLCPNGRANSVWGDKVGVTVEFCGESFEAKVDRPLIIGREGDVVIDDNPYLHRRFLSVTNNDGLGWLANVGSQLSATVADDKGLFQAWLAPGAQVPIVFGQMVVWFTAGPTAYELDIAMADAPFAAAVAEQVDEGETTIGRLALSPEQRLLIVALAEPILRRSDRGASAVPSSAEAARRLGWTLTKFNRKLDAVCEKLERQGVRGLHGGPKRLAANRRARLVEYCLAARIVDRNDLQLLVTNLSN